MGSLPRRHPVAAYYALAYAGSWAIALPLALQAQGILAAHLPFALHYLSGLGPAIAAPSRASNARTRRWPAACC